MASQHVAVLEGRTPFGSTAEMSGLSVVPRCFPKISVIASSGAYGSRAVPTGVLADAFYAKGDDNPDTLLKSVAALDPDFCRASKCPSERRCSGLDSTERERLEWNALY